MCTAKVVHGMLSVKVTVPPTLLQVYLVNISMSTMASTQKETEITSCDNAPNVIALCGSAVYMACMHCGWKLTIP